MALVLGRKLNQGLVIIDSNGVKFDMKVVENDRGDLRISIDAPKSITIMRSELYHGQTDVATK
ncbi:carbon storage regulator [Bacillus sp. CFBP9009]